MKRVFITTKLILCFSFLAFSQQEPTISPFAVSFALRPEFTIQETYWGNQYYLKQFELNNFNLSLLKFTKPGHLLEYELTKVSYVKNNLGDRKTSNTAIGLGVNYYFIFRKEKSIVPVIGPSATLSFAGYNIEPIATNLFKRSDQLLKARLNTVFGIFINPQKRFFYKITVPVNIIGIELTRSKNNNPSIPVNLRTQTRLDPFLFDDSFITAINIGVGMRISSK